MIRSLRRKFILIAMVSLVGTMAVLCTAIGIGDHYITTNRVDKAISILHQNGGTFLPPGSHFDLSDFGFQITPETSFEMRYFIVEPSAQREIRSVNLDHIAALDRQTVVETISRIINTGAARGYVDHYRFGVFPDESGGDIIIVLDCFLQLQATNNILRITVAIFLTCALIVFILLLCLSKLAIRPFVDNLESAKSQITRLDRLIKNLVELARTEETIKEDTVELFSISEIAQASADAVQPLAEADGKTLTAEIPDEVRMKGVRDNFFRLFSILLDNAVKYCDPAGAIHLSVSMRGRSICISVSNPCTGVDTAQLSRYFDRFYRADSSRARSTGGYGIGLSTAKAIVTRHHYADGVITFTAVIPQS